MRIRRIIVLLAAFVFMFSTQAYADLLLNNLDQPAGNLWNIGDTIGQAFTSGQAVTIDSATFRADYGSYVPTANAYLTIQNADSEGKIGSTILATWTTLSFSAPLVTYSGTYDLLANTTYWLVIHDTAESVVRNAGSTTYTANLGASLPLSNNNYESSTGNYYSLSDNPLMFQVTTNAVPIPAAVWLLGSGLIGLVGIRRRFKK
jgi:hypothetical protein